MMALLNGNGEMNMSYREPREPSEMPEFYDPEAYGLTNRLAIKKTHWVIEEDDGYWVPNEQQAFEAEGE